MLTLNTGHTFQYELLRVLSLSRDRGADVGEVLGTAPQIVPGNFESWYEQFNELADHFRSSVESQSDRNPAYKPGHQDSLFAARRIVYGSDAGRERRESSVFKEACTSRFNAWFTIF
jgi:hypothetical protein